MKDKINKAIKYRESFKPFNPLIIIEDTEDYFEGKKMMKFHLWKRF